MKRFFLSIMLAAASILSLQSAALAANTLGPGEILHKGDYRVSSNGRYELVLQDDGNLVLYDSSPYRPLWASNTAGKPVYRVVMQHDGNLVMYGPTGIALWASNTGGQQGSILVVQNDGNVVIYPATNARWATNTVQ